MIRTALAICALLAGTVGARAQGGCLMVDVTTGKCLGPIQGTAPGRIVPPDDPPDRSWHLFTRSYGGEVSHLSNLTKAQCEFIKAKVFDDPKRDRETSSKKACDKLNADPKDFLAQIECNSLLTAGDMQMAECFQ